MAGSAFQVVLAGKQIFYIFKTIDRPFYQPSDATFIQKGIKTLKLSWSAPSIVQVSGIVVSPNLYQTTSDGTPRLIKRYRRY